LYTAYIFFLQRSSVAGRWSVYHCIPTPERGNDATLKFCRVYLAYPKRLFVPFVFFVDNV